MIFFAPDIFEEPENSIKEIIEGFIDSITDRKLVVVGSTTTKLGSQIKKNLVDNRIIYLEYISDINKLNTLRYYSNLYFHGHTVGGTNPSLLEVSLIVDTIKKESYSSFIIENKNKILSTFSWDKIISQYEKVLIKD